jgi:hypothetical protein
MSRSGDLLAMNADVAKPIHGGLVYSEMVIDRDLAAMRPSPEHFVAAMASAGTTRLG